jgi:type II secretion system protein G
MPPSNMAQHRRVSTINVQVTGLPRGAIGKGRKLFRVFELGLLTVCLLVSAIAGARCMAAWLVHLNRESRHAAASVSRAKTDLATLRKEIDEFRMDCGRYPTNAEGLGALIAKPANAKGWHGPYLTGTALTDPWGREYIYQTPGRNGADGYLVESFGADGAPGGEGDDADLFDGTD